MANSRFIPSLEVHQLPIPIHQLSPYVTANQKVPMGRKIGDHNRQEASASQLAHCESAHLPGSRGGVLDGGATSANNRDLKPWAGQENCLGGFHRRWEMRAACEGEEFQVASRVHHPKTCSRHNKVMKQSRAWLRTRPFTYQLFSIVLEHPSHLAAVWCMAIIAGDAGLRSLHLGTSVRKNVGIHVTVRYRLECINPPGFGWGQSESEPGRRKAKKRSSEWSLILLYA